MITDQQFQLKPVKALWESWKAFHNPNYWITEIQNKTSVSKILNGNIKALQNLVSIKLFERRQEIHPIIFKTTQ